MTDDRVDLRSTMTSAELAALRSYAHSGSMKEAAHDLGLSYQTIKNQLHAAYQKLGASSAIEAYTSLGWLDPMGTYVPCGKFMVCSRPAGHRGHHGGFREVKAA